MKPKVSDQHYIIVDILFYCVLSFGCFWQIFNVCDLYFKYPTNIFIDTKFEPLSKPLPALSFCCNIGVKLENNLSSEALEYYSTKFKHQMFKSIVIYGDGSEADIKETYLSKGFERISLQYYCITLNTLLTGIFNTLTFFK